TGAKDAAQRAEHRRWLRPNLARPEVRVGATQWNLGHVGHKRPRRTDIQNLGRNRSERSIEVLHRFDHQNLLLMWINPHIRKNMRTNGLVAMDHGDNLNAMGAMERHTIA